MYAAFPRSEYYQRIRLPLQRLPFSGMIHIVRHTQPTEGAGQDHSGSLRFLDTSFSERAVPTTPPQSPATLPFAVCLLLPSSHYNAVGLRVYIFTRLNGFTFVTARSSLCLRLAHVVTLMSPRLDSR
jgi:hypothetical protein